MKLTPSQLRARWWVYSGLAMAAVNEGLYLWNGGRANLAVALFVLGCSALWISDL